MHSRVIRQELTQKLAGKMEAIMEELSLALHDELAKAPQGDNGIVKMNVWNTTMRVVARTSRNQEYLDAAVHFGITINSTVLKIRFMPALLRPILGPLVMIPRRRDRNVVAKHLNPIIKERMDIIKEINNDELAAKRLPNDVLTSLMFAARKEKDSAYEYTPYMLVNRMLALHFASIYTSTLTFTNVLFDLISLPPEEFEQTVASMREEVDNVLKEEGGWTRVAAYKMTLIDSFIKESIRMNGIGAVGLEKKVIAREGFTFSNGVHVPQNTSLGVPVHGLHHDPEVYPDPDKFDGARFARMRADTEDTADGAHILREGKKVGMTTTSPDYLPFGHGKHACPGRFFAANELKLLLAHIVTEYDLLPRARPKPTWVSVIILPDTGAEILMRKRQKPVAV
ncbi:MAG: hypothetical protein M4579_003204 [Chaenotheca gracillima]|nr:MAG: hypothetical protein M4579_003204 [Chaenotheca gracillima]